ncbi:pirin family protein [Ferruginibacter sp.]
MKDTSQAIIYLADNRGHLEGEWMRSLMTFNFGNYKAESREPFGTLQVLNEDTLAAGKSLHMQLEENTEVMIIPLVGTLLFTDDEGTETYIEPGKLQLISAHNQYRYAITNPFEKDELVNFIQVWLNKNEGEFRAGSRQLNIDLTEKNQLYNIIAPADLHQPAHCFIGQYNGRKKGAYSLQNKNNGVYAFVIDGVFEVQDRLLHPKDGLAIWNVDEIDFEALSNEAILLLFEVPL